MSEITTALERTLHNIYVYLLDNCWGGFCTKLKEMDICGRRCITGAFCCCFQGQKETCSFSWQVAIRERERADGCSADHYANLGGEVEWEEPMCWKVSVDWSVGCLQLRPVYNYHFPFPRLQRCKEQSRDLRGRQWGVNYTYQHSEHFYFLFSSTFFLFLCSFLGKTELRLLETSQIKNVVEWRRPPAKRPRASQDHVSLSTTGLFFSFFFLSSHMLHVSLFLSPWKRPRSRWFC